jgi:hypothetical protein
MRQIHEDLDMKVIVHTGITDAALAQELAGARVSAALIDVIGSDATIREVCHLETITTSDYDDSLGNLVDAGLDIVPHVVIGLHHGSIVGEMDALRIISRHDIQALVLVGLRPLDDTPLAGTVPPAPGEMARIFRLARELFPETPIMLGCERPAGEHKVQTDRLALEAGLDGIAFPADGIISHARSMGLEPGFSEMCCALLPDKGDSHRETFPLGHEASKHGGEQACEGCR